jgi:hypothetical protein
MHVHRKIFEFAASAGAFEGYVYDKELDDIDSDALINWAGNLVGAYENLPSDVLDRFQNACDQTVGRAIQSLTPLLTKDHEVIQKLNLMVKGELPKSADDFQKEKWHQG